MWEKLKEMKKIKKMWEKFKTKTKKTHNKLGKLERKIEGTKKSRGIEKYTNDVKYLWKNWKF